MFDQYGRYLGHVYFNVDVDGYHHDECLKAEHSYQIWWLPTLSVKCLVCGLGLVYEPSRDDS